MESEAQFSYGIVPDTHGQYEKVGRMLDILDPFVDKILFLGDVIDGPDSKRLIQLIRSLGDKAITIVGNHEWVCRNAMADYDDVNTRIWREHMWPLYEDRLLVSYGINKTASWNYNALALRELMQENGDYEWINNLPPYYETDEFVALHAGPKPNILWTDQKSFLNMVSSPKKRHTLEPEQIFSGEIANMQIVPNDTANRVFVSGHAHSTAPVSHRMRNNRICLASNISNGDPLFVWLSTQNEIVSF